MGLKTIPTRQRSSYHHGDLRRAILEATTTLVRREGLDALTLRKVASEIGVSAPAVYHHFPSKTHLIAGAAGAAFDRLDAILNAAEHAIVGSAARRLEALGVAYVRFALEQPGDFRLVFGAHVAALELGTHDCVRVPGRAAKTRIREAVSDAIAEVGSSMDAEDAMAIIWAQLVGIAALIAERELGPYGTVEKAEELARKAIRSHLEHR